MYKWRSPAELLPLSPPPDPFNNAARGDMFNYFVFGAACAEVELDVRTGTFQTRRADVLMDVGESLNVAIDVGQVEGAFVQGAGRWTMESMVWGGGHHGTTGGGVGVGVGVLPGHCATDNLHEYFIPSTTDAPRDLRVTLLGGAPNPRAVHSSKAVGEPPFFLSASVFFALKDAVRAARVEFLGCVPVPVPCPCRAVRLVLLKRRSLSASFRAGGGVHFLRGCGREWVQMGAVRG